MEPNNDTIMISKQEATEFLRLLHQECRAMSDLVQRYHHEGALLVAEAIVDKHDALHEIEDRIGLLVFPDEWKTKAEQEAERKAEREEGVTLEDFAKVLEMLGAK